MTLMLKNLGQRMRQLRKEKGLTLVEVSQKTGVAQATLSRIETGSMIGTLESHEKVAEVLGVGLTELYTGIDKRYDEITHTPHAARKVTHHSKDVQMELLTTDPSQKKITPLLVTIQPEAESLKQQSERGVEKFIYVLDGEIKAVVDKQSFVLKAGETLYLDASLPHEFANEKARPARLLMAVSPAKL